jgi:hypothetical protein
MMDLERVLELAIAEACAAPDRVGVCVVTATVDGCDAKAELIQFRNGWTRVIVSSARGNSRRMAKLRIDLVDELAALREEHAGHLRSTLPDDVARGYPMRVVIAAGGEGEWVVGQSPAEGQIDSNRFLDRLYRAAFVTEPATPCRLKF